MIKKDEQKDETGQAERRDRTSTKTRQSSGKTRQEKQKDETGKAGKQDRTNRKMKQDEQKDETGQAERRDRTSRKTRQDKQKDKTGLAREISPFYVRLRISQKRKSMLCARSAPK